MQVLSLVGLLERSALNLKETHKGGERLTHLHLLSKPQLSE
jgi:hypothetical protein